MVRENKEAAIQKEQPYAYWLACVAGIGNETKKKLAEYAKTAQNVYEMKEKELEKLAPKQKVRKIMEAKEKDICKAYEELTKNNIQFIPITHPMYPQRLKRIEDAPYGIYAEGELPEEKMPAVAVIGARQCSEYGRMMAARCGRELAERNVNVISGMARGIDGICQRAVLEAGGKTYAVMGCGTNVCYPFENWHIYENIKLNGAVISEYAPDTQPRPQLFPLRNRIISGLSDIVLIVEARERSGTLITADLALEQGKEVYVVPGRVTDLLSQGCLRLSRQGAGIMTSVKEMLEETGLLQTDGDMGGPETETKDYTTKKSGKEGKKENLILQALDYYPKNVEMLQQETKLPYREIVYTLVRMCIEGTAEQTATGQYVRK